MEGGSSISKVSVEYHDPSSIFAHIEKQLASQLPLRDVHWKSSTRPLRSIDTLHIEFVAASEFDRPGSRQEKSGADFGSPGRVAGERRHQIPGLRQTPYLKIFLLRCDDNETYKATARKALREWLKTHTPASQSSLSKSSQENHDAFEWLIVHVVYPDTTAASQPRTSGSSSKTDSVNGEKAGTSGKLLGRSSSTILDKIKADFNVSSKSAPDRVEQIRLRADESPSIETSTKLPGGGGDWAESGQDRTRSWQDLISKLKTLILASFNLRVSQYEDDIRERNSQRALPGWNFCTFFMLKEGLLRGFESVGLVDDALIGYDELSLDLDNAMMDENGDRTTTRSDSFLKYTKEMKDILVQSLTGGHSSEIVWQQGSQVISVSRKDYRSLIVNSNVSRLDFQSYIFARQMSILLRMSTPDMSSSAQHWTARNTVRGAKHLSALSELCHRTTSFISEASRTLKVELREAAKAQGVPCPESIIDNIVASFSFGTAEQILLATNVSELNTAWDESISTRQPQVVERLQHPERKSSLPARKTQRYQYDDSLALLKHLEVRSSINNQTDDELHVVQTSDIELLAGYRADLLLLQRYITEKVASQQGWRAGASRLQSTFTTDAVAFAEINLVEQSDNHIIPEETQRSSGLQGILYSSLLEGLSSSEEFSMLYETFTNLCLAQCVLARRLRTAEQLCADLAVLRYDAGDFSTALSYLSKIMPIYASGDWTPVEEGLMNIYLRCLKSLNRREDYVRMALSRLSKSASRTGSALSFARRGSALDRQALTEQNNNVQLLADILDVSASLSSNVVTSMGDLFANTTVDPYIRHLNDQDGFIVRLKFRFLLSGDLTADCVRLKLKSIEPPIRELWLESDTSISIVSGDIVVELRSNTTCVGRFSVEKIILVSKKISFETGIQSTSFLNLVGAVVGEQDESGLGRIPNILCYPLHSSLAVEVHAARDVQIGKTRLLVIRLQTNSNTVKSAQITVRAASAGLRLMTADAFVSIPGINFVKSKEPGMLNLPSLEAGSDITISLPYDLESNLPQVVISLDCQYTTSFGTFRYLSNPSVVVDLALDVSVHDLFKHSMLFSRFQIRASKGIPLLVSSVDLADTDRFTVEAPPCELTPMLVVPQQDGIVLYKIKSKSREQMERQSVKQEQPLQLRVEYQPLDEKVLALMQHALRRALAQSGFVHLTSLVCQVLSQVVRQLQQIHLEEIALVNEFRTPEFDYMGWNDLLNGLEPALRQGLALWLREWHQKNRVFRLASHHSDIPHNQQNVHSLKIDVPLPRLQVLCTAEISLLSRDFVSQGTVITATVSVHHSRRWETSTPTAKDVGSGNDELGFSLEVDAPADMWLLGGDRRMSFVSSERDVKTFDLLLVPLRVGRLLLPEVNVQWGGQGDEVRCETDYRSAGETVMVIADVKSTTIGMSAMLAGSEAVLVGSESRLLQLAA